MHLRSVREESDASRLLSLKSLFFVTFVSFFVSMMFALRKDRGNMHRRIGDRHGSGKMFGRLWICVVIDSKERRICEVVFFLIFPCYSC